MSTNQEVRKYLRKGEMAVKILEDLGYEFKQYGIARVDRWVAPEQKQVDPKEALAKFLRDQADALSPQVNLATPPIPAGRRFCVAPHRIPKWHSLSRFNANHFRGITFEVIRCFQPATEHYPTGWAVEFRMRTTPFDWENVWVPLSACAFH